MYCQIGNYGNLHVMHMGLRNVKQKTNFEPVHVIAHLQVHK